MTVASESTTVRVGRNIEHPVLLWPASYPHRNTSFSGNAIMTIPLTTVSVIATVSPTIRYTRSSLVSVSSASITRGTTPNHAAAESAYKARLLKSSTFKSPDPSVLT